MDALLREKRSNIDHINKKIVELLADRAKMVDDLCDKKAAEGESVRDKEREQEILGFVSSVAEEEGVSDAMVRDVFKTVLEHSVARQRRRRANGEGPEY